MTPEELKEKCREIMLTHLESKGYPNLTRRGILIELKPMWVKLEEHGLISELNKLGWTYELFCNEAMRQAQESAIFERLGGFVRIKPRRV